MPIERPGFEPARGTRPTVEQHFEGRAPAVRAIYDRIKTIARAAGSFREEPKRTSIHLTRNSAFAGIATRKDALILRLKSATDISSPRISRREHTSANRWHLELRLVHPNQVDAQLESWLKKAIALAE